jgi:hypothetical protein
MIDMSNIMNGGRNNVEKPVERRKYPVGILRLEVSS